RLVGAEPVRAREAGHELRADLVDVVRRDHGRQQRRGGDHDDGDGTGHRCLLAPEAPPRAPPRRARGPAWRDRDRLEDRDDRLAHVNRTFGLSHAYVRSTTRLVAITISARASTTPCRTVKSRFWMACRA